MKQSQNTQIEALLEQLKQEFIAELPNRLHELEELTLGLQKNDNYAEIYRSVHSLKGSGGTHGIEILSFACHQLEEELERLNKNKVLKENSTVSVLLEYLDILYNIQLAAQHGEDKDNSIRDRLQQVRDKTVGAALEVLIIEPSQSISAMLSQILSALPVNSTFTDNGLNGIELLLNRTFQVVITAYETRLLNGLAVIAAAKSQRRYKKLGLTTIVISSNAPDFEPSSLTPDYCLKRSINLDDQIIEILNAVLNGK